jgi:hypothetical protein
VQSVGLTSASPIFFVSITFILLFYVTMSDKHHDAVPAESQRCFHFNYMVQKGYFQQSEDSTNDKDFDFVSS